jgi:hypothetical protein
MNQQQEINYLNQGYYANPYYFFDPSQYSAMIDAKLDKLVTESFNLSLLKERFAKEKETVEKDKKQFLSDRKRLEHEHSDIKHKYFTLCKKVEEENAQFEKEKAEFSIEHKNFLLSQKELEEKKRVIAVEMEQLNAYKVELDTFRVDLKRERENLKKEMDSFEENRKRARVEEGSSSSDEEIQEILLSLSSELQKEDDEFKRIKQINLSCIYPSIKVDNYKERFYVKIDGKYAVAPITSFVAPFIADILPNFTKNYVYARKPKLVEGDDYVMVRIQHIGYTNLNMCLTGKGLVTLANQLKDIRVTTRINELIRMYDMKYIF